MLHDIDAALRSLLGETLPEGTVIRFDPPGTWPQETHRAVVDAFLHQVREDLEGRAGSWLEQRDGRGRVVGRQPPPRRYRLCYLVTAWASEIEDEHALLGSALAALAAHDTVPVRHLRDALLGTGIPVTISVAHPELPSVPADIWSALGTTPRSALNLVVTAPLPQPAITELARAPEAVELGVAGGPPPAPARERPLPVPRKRVQERG